MGEVPTIESDPQISNKVDKNLSYKQYERVILIEKPR